MGTYNPNEPHTNNKNELVRMSKSAFSDTFQAWIHLKALRVYVESVLRYGLPPEFVSAVIQVHLPLPVTTRKVFTVATSEVSETVTETVR